MNEDLKRWDEIAEEWVNDVIPKGLISEYQTKPVLKELLGDVRDKIILDAGCGHGRYTNFVSELGAKTIGIDGSEKMVGFARKFYPNIEFTVADLTGVWPFSARFADAIISDSVLMSMSDISKFMSEACRVLKDEGTIIISVLHPAFNHPTLKLYKTWFDKLIGGKVKGLVFDYYQTKTIRKDANATKGLNFYHRTLETYSNEFANAGFVIKKIVEPRITDQKYIELHPKIEYAARMPRFIFFKLIKSR